MRGAPRISSVARKGYSRPGGGREFAWTFVVPGRLAPGMAEPPREA
jgi:hypothetical protein